MAVQRLSNSGRNGYSYKSLIAGITPIPSVPTIGTATELTYESATVEFTAPGDYSGSTYTATSSPGGFTGTSATSPIVVTGLSELTTYTFTVTATNATGTSGASAASNSITTPAAFTPTGLYDALATYTVPSGGVSSVTFAGFPTSGQYTHLQVRYIARGTSVYASGLNYLTLNNDTGTNYFRHYMLGDGSSVSASGGGGNTSIWADALRMDGTSANIFTAGVVDILDYANTSKYKTVRILSGDDTNGGGRVGLWSGALASTSAVTSITFTPSSDNFAQFSQFSLYGVKG